MTGELWTQERTERVTKLWEAGLSCSQIAADIGGVTRNAVIGKIHRLKLADPSYKKKPKPEPKPKAEKKPRVRKYQGNHHAIDKIIPGGNGTFRIIETSESAKTIKLRCVEIVPRNLTLLDLEPGDCRYPYSEGDGPITFCGHGPRHVVATRDRITGAPGLKTTSYCTPHFFLTIGNGTPSERAATSGIGQAA